MPRSPRRREIAKLSPTMAPSKKPASILETATIMQAAAKPVARSARETGRAFQYSAALDLWVWWCFFTSAISSSEDSIRARRSIMGCL